MRSEVHELETPDVEWVGMILKWVGHQLSLESGCVEGVEVE